MRQPATLMITSTIGMAISLSGCGGIGTRTASMPPPAHTSVGRASAATGAFEVKVKSWGHRFTC
jgi:uncharacterized protein YceK